MGEPAAKMRLDKWLWQARFFKTRSLAAKVVTAGHCRVNSAKVLKSSHQITPGDILTFMQGDTCRIVEVAGIGKRRGPAPEAQTLYKDMTPVQEKGPPAVKSEGKGRPTKKDRRDMRLSRDLPLE